MSQDQKIHKHAPWCKKVLVPLWTLQLAFCIFQVVSAGINLSATMTDDDTWEDDQHKIITWAVGLAFNLKLALYTIFIIIRFAKFQLSTTRFRWQSIYAVFLGILGLIVFIFNGADQHILTVIIQGAEVAVSLGICIYVIATLKKVRRGELGEMRMPGVGEVEAQVEVELESGRKEVPRQ